MRIFPDYKQWKERITLSLFVYALKSACLEKNNGEFELQSHYYVHFQINTFGKGIKPLILLAIG